MGFPGSSDGKESACNMCRAGFDPWVGNQVLMAGAPPAVSGVRTLKRSPGSGGRGWARALYLVPPAEEASGVDVGVRLVFIVRHLDVVPHAVVHHLARARPRDPWSGSRRGASSQCSVTGDGREQAGKRLPLRCAKTSRKIVFHFKLIAATMYWALDTNTQGACLMELISNK